MANAELYVNLLGIHVEEIRTDYCRMRMPWREALNSGGRVARRGDRQPLDRWSSGCRRRHTAPTLAS